ncbi:MAG: alanine racemase [Chloroflexi bacterium]|nr:alanine racemase [Chloroflexota bacterium]
MPNSVKTSSQKDTALSSIASVGPAASAYLPSAVVPEGTLCELVDPWLEINTKNLAWNVSQVRNKVGDTPIMAVVKCNAYGHGTVGVAQVLEKQGIQQFAVVKVQEAVALRENGVTGTILNFGPISPLEADQIVRYDISQSIFSEAVGVLANAARRLNKQAKVHIKVDTGLSRVGVPYHETLPFIEKIASMPGLVIEGIFTTLTEEADFDRVQIERLLQVCDEAKKRGISVGTRHASSSDAVATLSVPFLDMVRPGNCFYGFEPLPNLNLKPVMSLKTRVILVKKMRPEDTIAYHRQRQVEKEMLLAILPMGYADGYPHQVVDKAQVLIRGRRWPIIVYMSANHAFVDITGSRDIKVGDEVVLFGTQEGETISLQELAKWADSSVYKVATGMSPFLPRVSLK